MILLLMVSERMAAACSMPARKLAGAAIAAASKMRFTVNPLLDVSATTEPVPPDPEPLTAAIAWTDSSGRVGATGVDDGGVLGVPPPLGPDERAPKLISLPPGPKSESESNGSEARCDLIA